MLRAVLYQMLEKKRSLYPAYQRHFRRSRSRHALNWTFQDLESCLLGLQFENEWKDKGIKTTFILVVDGLDESEDDKNPGVQGASRKQALKIFPRLCESNGNHAFKVIALSRNEGSIKTCIDANWFLDMKEVNGRDIEKIADAGVRTLWQKICSADSPGSNPDTQPVSYEENEEFYGLEFIRKHLIKHADGVILWVVLVLRELEGRFDTPGVNRIEIEEALEKIPTRLGELYQDMFDRLRRIPSRDEEKAGHLFTWLLYSNSTLKVCEIRDVMAMFSWGKVVEPTLKHCTFDNHRPRQLAGDWRPIKRLLDHLCGGFVEIIPQQRRLSDISPYEYPVNPGDSVQLIHQTARDFLIHPKSELKTSGTLRTLDDICLDCMSYTELVFKKPLPDAPAHEVLNGLVDRLQENPLLGYILHTFPTIMDIQTQAKSSQSRTLWQRIAEFADSAEQDRWSSVTWWFLRPWIERLFSNGHYTVEDNTQSNLRLVLDPEIVKSALIRHIIRVGFRYDNVTAATEIRGSPRLTIKESSDSTIIRDLRSIDSSLIPARDVRADRTPFRAGPPTNTSHSDTTPTILPRIESFDDRKGHLCRMYWGLYDRRAGIFNRYLLLHAIFVAKRREYSIASNILAVASADKSGAPDKTMNYMLRSWVEDNPSGAESHVPKPCINAVPFQSMAESCYYLRNNSGYVEDWCNGIEIDGTPAVPPDEETVSEASITQR